ncbi:MAG: hypothetical protein WBG57_03850 [Ornithinimicrobium sp.]
MGVGDSGLLVAAAVGIMLAVLLGVGWYLSYTAVRLDRLHIRLEATAAALDAQLVRRAHTAADLAYEGVLDPASAALLLDATDDTFRHAGAWTPQRADAESSLTQILGLVTPELPEGQQSEVEERALRVHLARTFHNEAVASVRSVRGRPLVRWLNLAGHTALPLPVVFTDREKGPDGAWGGRLDGP